MPKMLTNNERRRLTALGQRLIAADSATSGATATGDVDGCERAIGELLQGAIYAALEAVIPGRQKRKQIDAENDRAYKAVIRFLARRTKKPNPHQL